MRAVGDASGVDRPDTPEFDLPAPLARFPQLAQHGELTPASATSLAHAAASAFLQHHISGRGYLADAVALLGELATSADPALAQAGMHGLFPHVIEWLGDAFDPAACALYNQLFIRIIQYCRRLPSGTALDKQLQHFGLVEEHDLADRAARVRAFRRFDRSRAGRIQKAFVLSRVTLGADIAVTSLVLAKLKQVCPHATVLLLGGPRTRQLFAGDARVCVHPLEYPRGGGLIARLHTWLTVVEAIQREVAGLEDHEYLIVDPDSRLTQLGLLPVTRDEGGYHFFESRSYQVPGLHSLGELTAHWLGQVFGPDGEVAPYFAPSREDVSFARSLVTLVRGGLAGPVVSVNFGVGANPRKRVPDPFERSIVEGLLQSGAWVVLDSGGEPEEMGRIAALTGALEAQGARVCAIDAATAPGGMAAAVQGARLIVWRGSIGRFGALIGESDVYLGYDSAGQHLGAALGVPTIDLFAGFSSPRMPARWRPHGPGPVRMFVIDPAETLTPVELDGLVSRVLMAVAELGGHGIPSEEESSRSSSTHALHS